MPLKFLSVEAVLELHRLQISEFGGLGGIRSRELLESAVSQPRSTFDGRFLHKDVFTMAAAYLYHIVKNHPFADGNKRVGLQAALSFLGINGHPIETGSDELYSATISVTRGDLDKDGLAEIFRRLAPGP